MVATLQKLQPPRAMRWVTRWKWITIVLLALGIGIAIRFEHLLVRLVLVPIILGFCYWAFTVFRHRGRIVGQGAEGEALVANVLDNLHDMDARVLHSVQFESG